MMNVRPAKEVVITLENDVGALNEIAKIVAGKGINILAMSSWVEGSRAVVHLVTEDSVRVADALRARDYSVREADVLMAEVQHKPGMLRHVTERLAKDGIDIHHLYATATAAQDVCLFVFATAHNDRAMLRLRG
jgi:hypothetical protein